MKRPLSTLSLVATLALALTLTLRPAPSALASATKTAEDQLPSPPEETIRAMERVEHWVGHWQGSGWAATGPGQRRDFEINETVTARLAGSILLIEGRGTSMTEDGQQIVTHDALGILSYDPAQQHYNLRSHDLRGGTHDAELKVDDEGMRWGFRDENSGMLLRFEIRIDGDTWHEIGYVSPDEGGNWYPILDMTLQRQDRDAE